VVVNLPHGAGSTNCAIASTDGKRGEWARTKAKVRSLLLFFFLSLLGSGLRMQGRRMEQRRQRQMAR
jgi:hypothetical protein